MEQYQDSLSTVFHALADPTRRTVLAELGRGPASVTQLAAPFEMTLPSFMKHIRFLEGSGLIRTRKNGRVRMCELDKSSLATVDNWLHEQRAIWEARTDRLEAFVTKKEGKGAPE